MRRLLFFVALFAVACAGGASSAQATMYACWGAPADYVAAFDTARGQTKDGLVKYPYKTVFLEWQSQLTPSSSPTVGDSSEHIHAGACMPEGQTLNDANAKPWYLDARYIFHNMLHYTVTSASATVVSKTGSTGIFFPSAAQVSALNDAAQLSDNNGTANVYQSYASAAPTSNGIKELRWQVQVDRNSPAALVDFWKLSARAYFTQSYTGLPTSPTLGEPDCHIDFVRSQTWVRGQFDADAQIDEAYNYAGFGDSLLTTTCGYPASFGISKLAQARPASWTTNFRETDGTNRGMVIVDPNNHVSPETYAWRHDMGIIPSSANETNLPVTVPLSTLGFASGSIHRLMIMGHEWPNQPVAKPILTAITVMPFKVQ